MALPARVALKSVDLNPNKYLGFINDGTQNQGFLAYSTDQVLSPFAKFAVENAGNGLVHIRSCYNNKYWVRSSASDYWIVATASEPMDDQSAWNCTLFKPILIDGGKSVKFVHVQLGSIVGRPNNYPTRNTFLCAIPSATVAAVSNVIDYGSLVKFPKYVAFKGDNGLYYRNSFDGDEYCHFATSDLGDPYTVYEIISGNDGNVRVKVKQVTDYDAFWKRFSPQENYSGYIGTTIDMVDNRDEWFSVIKLGDNVVALRNLGNNMFCQRVSDLIYYRPEYHVKDALSASASSITKAARLQIVDPVLTRTVNVLEFDLKNVRIYNRTPLALASETVTNNTSIEQESPLQFSYTSTRTYSWSNSISLSFGVSASFTSGIPEISQGSIQVSTELGFQYQFGKTIDKTQQVSVTPSVKVPPKSKVKATLVATIGTCDIPFSYLQIDQFANGDRIRTTMSDGTFTGVNLYDFNVTIDPVA